MIRRGGRILSGVFAAGFVVSLAAPAAQAAPSPAGLAYMNVRVCATPALGHVACDAIRHQVTDPAGKNNHGGGHKPGSGGTTPVSYDAAQLQDAYGLSNAASTDGDGVTVAIVDAYDDPNALNDLQTYRAHEGLPPMSTCAVSGNTLSSPGGPCFAKVNQSGTAGSYPTGSTSWGQEISLDVDMVSAICPNCNILLVEADSSSLANLGSAVNTAAAFKPASIGNSYGAAEFNGEAAYASTYYDHPGIAVTVAAGDNGYGAEFPAAANTVIAVGGTTLQHASTGWSQTVWSGTGSGCSAYIAKPSWQTDTGCLNRTVGDVAADADPNTGVNVYDTYGQTGWLVFGGTSASTQIIGAVYGLADNGASNASGLYSNTSTLYDVTSGSNGSCTGHGHNTNTSLAYLCNGEPGYDGPTGTGTPNGSLTAF